MGKGGGVPSLKPGPLEKEQAKFLQTQRTGIIEPAQATLFAPALGAAAQGFDTSLGARDRQALEGQYNQARNNILQTGARGGLMQNMLTNTDNARAESVANAINQARQTGISRGLGALGPTAFPGAQSIIAGGQGAAQSEAQRIAQNAQNKIAGQQAAGQGLGSMLGGLGALAGGTGGMAALIPALAGF